MIIISDCSKNIVIPAGLGDNAGVVYETAGVKSLNGETGDLKIKTVNGNDMLGEGNIEIKGGVKSLNGQTGDLKIKSVNGAEMLGEGNVAIDTGVESLNGQKGNVSLKTVNGNELTGNGNIEIKGGVETVNGETGDVKIKTVNGQSLMGEGDVPVDVGVETLNGQKGALTLKTVNGNELTGDGNIEIKAGVESVNGKTGAVVIPALQYFEVSQETKKEAYDEIANHWDDNSGYTGDCIFCYKKPNGGVYTFTEIGYLKDHSVYFSWLNNQGAYSIGDGKVKCFAIIIWYNAGDPSMDTYEKDCIIPTKVSELTNDSGFQTKAEVDTAIENALGGGGSTGSDNVIVLDGLTQEERKTVYEKIDQTKLPAFIYDRATSIYSFTLSWLPEPRTIKFYTLKAEGSGMHLVLQGLESDGSITTESKPQNYVNSLFINANNHVNDNADFECSYTGSIDYIKSSATRPNSYFIFFSNGIGDTTKPVFAPVSVIWDNNNFDGNSPFRIQFTANEKLYTYLHGDAGGKWLFESAKPIGGVQSSEVSNIKVLTQAEYDTLTPKDDNVLYCIKG